MSTVTTPELTELFRRMAHIRAFEQRVAELYRNSEIPGFIHTSTGQEAVAVGVCAWLDDADYLVTTHRGHGHVLSKGTRMDAAMAELFGKATGPCKGKGGSMHIADARRGILGANAIVGAGLPLATGAGLACKLRGEGAVSVAFFGEGAVNQGAFHESLNLAAIWDLPVLFVCENNLYAEFTDSRTMSRRESVAAAVTSGYGIESEIVDGNDVEAVAGAAAQAVSACRGGDGPRLLEALTYRYQGHYEGDQQAYKLEEEVTEWQRRDPLTVARKRLLDRGEADATALDALVEEAGRAVASAETFARESEYPSLEEIWADVYVD